MSGLRLEIDLAKIGENASSLVDRAAASGVSVTAVTKAFLGDAQLAHTLVAAGADALGDSRIENIERMRHAHVGAPMVLIRTPMPSQVDRVVRSNTMSINSETVVLDSLATAARVCGRVHDVMIMVELGDLRDGVMPTALHDTARHVLRHPSLRLRGIGGNLACRNGIVPSDANMGELSDLVAGVETAFGVQIHTVSGGNSASLGWLAATATPGRVNDLRLGESILLGRDPLRRHPIPGLHTDAIIFVAEVIESHRKPTRPWGQTQQNAFGESPSADSAGVDGEIWQTIVATGRQDVDHHDLRAPEGMEILAASSDHLMVRTATRLAPGSEIRFEPGYAGVLRSMTSPFVRKELRRAERDRPVLAVSSRRSAPPGTPPSDTVRPPRLTLVPLPTSAATGGRACDDDSQQSRPR